MNSIQRKAERLRGVCCTTRPGMARRGKPGLGRARQGLFTAASGSHRCPVRIAPQGSVWRVSAWQGMARPGKAWRGKGCSQRPAGHTAGRCESHHKARQCGAGRGLAWHGMGYFVADSRQRLSGACGINDGLAMRLVD